MANLIYAEYNTGCSVYWYLDDSGPADYHYGIDASRACYYADLEPNTTYTIQCIDSSDKFRVALTSQDLKYLTATSDTVVQTPFSWGYKADNSLPITFTTGSDNIHLVVLYTTTSQYTIRVMLNEGSTIEPYEAPTRYFKNHWRLINGKLINNDLPEPIESNLTPPYPASLWRLDSDDVLTLNNEDWSPFPESLSNFTPPYPASMWYLDENNKLMNALLPDELKIGAFSNNMNLKGVYIPPSVKRIGPYSFMNTALTKAKIATECTYSEETFPPGCVINHY